MRDSIGFIRSYYDFRRSVDFSKRGILPDLENIVWCMLMGVPEVPADEQTSADAPVKAIDQRVAILKAVFVEVNGAEADEFLDQGMLAYDKAGKIAKEMLMENADISPSERE